ncbi:MAG: FG-GAP-like repeat-containing protein [Planctomycetota bacterium]
MAKKNQRAGRAASRATLNVEPAAEARRPRKSWPAILIACALVAAAFLGWKWVSGGENGGSSPPLVRPAGKEAAASEDPIRAEFLAVAEKLFTTPGGLMDRTGSKVLRAAIDRPGSDWAQNMLARCDLVIALLKEDETEQAVEAVETIFRLLASQPAVLHNEPKFHRLRALAYLRLAEVQNCITRHNRDCCVFPLKGDGIHTEKSPAAQAASSLFAFLRAQPEDLEVRWLLNIVYMAQGGYPDAVPKEFLIPEKSPNSSDDFPRFRDVARECGLDRLNHAGGVIADDMDGDGLLDIVLSSNCPDVPLAFYHNRGDGTFEEFEDVAGLSNQLGGLNLVSTDHDNDGDLDILVQRGGWLFDEGRIRKSLLRNNGDGSFTDVTHAAGLAESKCPMQTSVWFDYDNDGDLDVFFGNESRADPVVFPKRGAQGSDYPCNLFRNNGDGTFTDVARQAGVLNDRYCKGATAGDYDNDGWPDLYVSNIGANRLYRNNRDGTFSDVAETLGVAEPVRNSFVPWFFDFDNDGNLDIFVAAYDRILADIPAWYLGLPFKSAPPRLYRNKGDGTFEDITQAARLWRPMQPMGANFGDLDNDGWLDMYLTTGNPEYEALMPNVMLRNCGGTHFEDVTIAGGFGSLQKGHGVAFADFDDDGDQDVFNDLGGFYKGDVFYNSLFENPGNSNGFLTLKLIGTRTNRLAYGARIHVIVRTPTRRRSLHRAVGSVSSFGGSPSRQEIGLGDAEAIESVEIWWPASGLRQKFTDLELNSHYEVTEDAAAPRKLERKPFRLGGD